MSRTRLTRGGAVLTLMATIVSAGVGGTIDPAAAQTRLILTFYMGLLRNRTILCHSCLRLRGLVYLRPVLRPAPLGSRVELEQA